MSGFLFHVKHNKGVLRNTKLHARASKLENLV